MVKAWCKRKASGAPRAQGMVFGGGIHCCPRICFHFGEIAFGIRQLAPGAERKAALDEDN